MRKSKEQIAYAISQVEQGAGGGAVPKDGNQRAALLRVEEEVAGMGIAELKRVKQLEEENRRLKGLVADLTLDKHMLQEVLRKYF